MKNFFKGISFTQVLAGSLAAVTSFLLSSKIGIAGSVIGVAIGSIVSAVASQIYQNVIRASKEKIQNPRTQSHETNNKEIAQATGDDIKMSNVPVSGNFNNANNFDYSLDTDNFNDTINYEKPGNDNNINIPRTRTISSNANDESINNTRVMELAAIREQREEDMQLSNGSDENPIPLSKALRNSNRSYSQENISNDHMESRYKKLVILVSVLSALAAVVITAGAILLFTQGKGTDNINYPKQEQNTNNQEQPNQLKQQNKNEQSENNTKEDNSDKDSDDSNADDNEDSKTNNNDDETGNSGDDLSQSSQPGTSDQNNTDGNSGYESPSDSSNSSSAGSSGSETSSGSSSGSQSHTGSNAGSGSSKSVDKSYKKGSGSGEAGRGN